MMIDFILGWFGYVKVPKAAIILSMETEKGLEILTTIFPNHDGVKQLLEGAKTITKFLRSGRLLTTDYGR